MPGNTASFQRLLHFEPLLRWRNQPSVILLRYACLPDTNVLELKSKDGFQTTDEELLANIHTYLNA